MVSGRSLARQAKALRAHLAYLSSEVEAALQMTSTAPDQSLIKARKIAEAIIDEIAADTIEEEHSSWILDRKIGHLAKNGTLPRLIEANFRNLQKLGNIAAHGSNEGEINETVASPGMVSLEFVFSWYRDDYHEIAELGKEQVEMDFGRGASGLSIALLGAFFWALGVMGLGVCLYGFWGGLLAFISLIFLGLGLRAVMRQSFKEAKEA